MFILTTFIYSMASSASSRVYSLYGSQKAVFSKLRIADFGVRNENPKTLQVPCSELKRNGNPLFYREDPAVAKSFYSPRSNIGLCL